MTSTGFVAVPGGDVDFNDNIIVSEKMGGGYTGYQLWPNGKKQAPVAQISKEPLTLSNVNSMFCYKEGDSFDLYLCDQKLEFERGEHVDVQGPIHDPINKTRSFIQMIGRTSTTYVSFYLTTSTLGQNANPAPVPGGQAPPGRYTLTVTVESSTGQVVFQTKTTI